MNIIDKTTVLMALTCFDATFDQMKPFLISGIPDAVKSKFNYRMQGVKKALVECWHFVRDIDGARPLSVPAGKSITGFVNAFAEAAKTKQQMLAGFNSEFFCATYILHAAELLCCDLAMLGMDFYNGQKCWRDLRNHADKLTEICFNAVSGENDAPELCEFNGVELYYIVADYLKQKNHEKCWCFGEIKK